MSKCNRCLESIPSEDDMVKCNICNSKLHFVCAGVREAKWRIKSADDKSLWKCDACKKELLSPTTQSQKVEIDMNTIATIIKKIVHDENDAIIKKMETFQKSIEFYSEQLDEYTVKINNVLEENKIIKKNYEELKDKYNLMEKKVEDVALALEEANQYSRNKNVIIDGIPETQGENLLNIILILGQKVNMKIDPTDVQTLHRLPRKQKPNTKATPILVQFNNRMVRDGFLNNMKSKEITLEILNLGNNNSKIYFNEHLTPYYSKLHYEAKNKKINGQNVFKYVWIKNGKVLARKSDNAQVQRINTLKDIC